MLSNFEMTPSTRVTEIATHLDCGCAYERYGRKLKVLNRCSRHELLKFRGRKTYRWITSAGGRNFFEGARMYRCGCIYPKGVDPIVYRCPIHEAFLRELQEEIWANTWPPLKWAAFIFTGFIGIAIVGVLIAMIMGTVTLILDVCRKLGYLTG